VACKVTLQGEKAFIKRGFVSETEGGELAAETMTLAILLRVE